VCGQKICYLHPGWIVMAGRLRESADRHYEASQYQPLVAVVVACAAGIVLDRISGLPSTFWWVLAVVAWFGWAAAWRWGASRSAAWLLLGSVLSTAGGWHHGSWDLFLDDDLGRIAREAPQPVCIEAVAMTGLRPVPAPPASPLRSIVLGDQTRLRVRVVRLRDGRYWRSCSGLAQMFVDGHLPNVRVGDRLHIFAQLLKPRPALNPGEFNSNLHQRADRVLSRVYVNYPECVTVGSSESWRNPWRALERVRTRSHELLSRHIRYERSPLAAAVLLGAREQLDPERVEAFVVTGTIHLFAISGLHVGILAASFFWVARCGMVSRRWALLAVIILTITYAMLTDARPPVVRATILVVVTCAAMLSGRRPLALNALAAAALGVLVYNPADLFRTGTQLSFLAVATLSWFGPRLLATRPADPLQQLVSLARPWPVRMARRFGARLWRVTLASGVIWLVALPLVMYRFHLFSPIAVLLNALLWIPMAVALFAGFGVLLLAEFFPFAGDACGWLCGACLAVLENTVCVAQRAEGGHWWVSGPACWWLCGFYGILGWGLICRRLCPPRRWCVAVIGAWILVGCVVPWIARGIPTGGEPPLYCTILSVGHGSSIVLELPNGQTLLYDAGSLGSPITGTRSVSSFLWSRGITHLDHVIISHADIDHFNALPGLIARFSVGSVYVSPCMFQHDDPALLLLQEAIVQQNLPVHCIVSGDRLPTEDSVRIQVLHPPLGGVDGNDNANSIVLLVEYQGRRILLPGDLEAEGLHRLLGQARLPCQLVMAPHHGSPHSEPAAFAAWCQPRWVVISSGHGHDISTAREAYRSVNCRVLETVQSGAIRVTVDPQELRVRGWRHDRW